MAPAMSCRQLNRELDHDQYLSHLHSQKNDHTKSSLIFGEAIEGFAFPADACGHPKCN